MRDRETDLITKLMVAMTGGMTILVAMFAYMAFKPVGPQEPLPPAPPRPPPCDLSRPDGAACDEGLFCLHGRCQPLEDEDKICGEGESCLNCDCDDGLLCHQLRCQPAGAVTLAPPDCRDPGVAGAIEKLTVACESRGVTFDGLKSLSSCSADDWKQILLKEESFGHLTSFKHRFSVHFAANHPSPGRRFDDTHLFSQLERLRGPLASAKQIFIIGRSSPDGDVDRNYDLALRRIDKVTTLIERVVHGSTPRTARRSLPIRQWGLKGERLIATKFFAERYVSRSIRDEFNMSPMIAEDAATEQRIVDLLAQSKLHKLSAADDQWLVGALNRVVIVVPIPCDGTEYKPPEPILPARTDEAAR
jgi:hypothetical protein